MSSQRAREARIVKKLRSGTLFPAPSKDAEAGMRAVLESTPGAEGRCHGCDEPEVDARLGGQPWHHLCYLFWQGRSESIRDSHVLPERSHWVIVVRVDRPKSFTTFQRDFAGSPWVDVVMDRRARPSTSRADAPEGERRGPQDHAGGAGAPAAPLAFRRVYRGMDFAVYEATAPLAGRCPQCGVLVAVELPSFADPPVRLELTVVHEALPPAPVRHVVEARALSATGRVILASRLRARPLTRT